MALFQFLSQNTRGKSTALNMLDNPFGLALSGAYDEVAAGLGSQGPMGPYQMEFGNSDSPIMRDVLQQVQMGMTPEWLSSYVQQKYTPEQIAEETNYLSDDFNSAIRNLQQEFVASQKSSGENDEFSKRGFRRPSEQYTLDDVPLAESSIPRMQKVSDEANRIMAEMTRQEQTANLARKSVSKSPEAILAQMAAEGKAEKRGDQYLIKSGDDLMKVNPATGEVENMFGEASPFDALRWIDRNVLGRDKTVDELKGKKSAPKKKDTIMSRWAEENKDYVKRRTDEAGRADIRRSELNQEMWKNVSVPDEIERNALLMLAQSQGRTPFKDQFKTYASFLAGM